MVFVMYVPGRELRNRTLQKTVPFEKVSGEDTGAVYPGKRELDDGPHNDNDNTNTT